MYTHSSHLLMMMIGMGHFNMMKNVMAHHVGVSPSIYLMHCLYNRIKFTCTAVTMFVTPHMYNLEPYLCYMQLTECCIKCKELYPMSIMRDHVESCTAELEEITQCNYTPSGAAVAQAEPDLEQAVTQLVSGVDVCRVISLRSHLVDRSPPCTWPNLTAHGLSS